MAMQEGEDIFNGRLLSGERVLWSGRPGRGLLFTPQDAFLIPFSLVWAGVALSIATRATQDRAGLLAVVPWLFVCIGFYLVIGRFLIDAWARGRLYYRVTDQRILIATAGPFAKFTALYLTSLPQFDLREMGGGRGTIRFGATPPFWSGRQGSWSPAFDPTPQFLAIDEARQVYDLIQRSIGRKR